MTNQPKNILPWHKTAFAKLQGMIAQNHLPHALLITGDKNIGKFELMQNLVGVLIGDDEKIRADNVLENADMTALIRRSKYENLVYIRAGEYRDEKAAKAKKISKEILVQQVRAFCDALNKTADKLQIGVIFYADEMNANAANSLLKTLEEPRENTLIILLAHNAKNLPATIVSRCQTVHISPAYGGEVLDWISAKMPAEQRGDFDVEQLLENTHGVPFNALAELSGDGFVHYQHWQNQLLNIALHPATISKLEDFNGNEIEVLNCLQNLIIEAIRLKSLKNEGGLVELNQVVKNVKIDFLFKFLNDIYRALALAKTPINLPLLFDNILIIWSHITHLKTYPTITQTGA
ncbi:MAG: DNA polymerase III subunit delta' [Candidatus Thioglobus sp.]|nr:DNA polymerase III subunit delta' [Candidatus Thioglobus sp.]